MDPATEHPNSPRIIQIIEAYKKLYKLTGQDQPLVKNASFISAEEVMASAEMGCHSVTLSPQLLEELSSLPYDPTDEAPKRALPHVGPGRLLHAYRDATVLTERFLPLSLIDPLDDDNKPADIDAAIKTDYLASNGKALDEAIAADKQAARRLRVALETFIAAEERSKEKIEKVLNAL